MLLLNWCQNILKPYVDLEIAQPVKDFSQSWQNGIAFLSLIHSIRNDIVPEIDILVQEKDWYNNLERAFNLAEKHFKIISLLEPNDIVSVKNPDERIIMTYISEFYWYINKEKK
ncbi:hypothetical protein PIROE2DRAFT_51238, partial [Piromyces sp. E2]